MWCGLFPKNKPAAQAAEQTLPDATPPVGQIHIFSKIAVTFEPIQFDALQDLESLMTCQYSLFYDWKHLSELFGHDGAVKIFYLKGH